MNSIQKIKNTLVASLIVIGITLSTTTASSWAFSTSGNYIPPEIAYASDLRERVTIPAKVNLNKAGLGELMTLPGIDENIALKLMRIRPIEDIQDLKNLPWLESSFIDRIINTIQGKITF